MKGLKKTTLSFLSISFMCNLTCSMGNLWATSKYQYLFFNFTVVYQYLTYVFRRNGIRSAPESIEIKKSPYFVEWHFIEQWKLIAFLDWRLLCLHVDWESNIVVVHLLEYEDSTLVDSNFLLLKTLEETERLFYFCISASTYKAIIRRTILQHGFVWCNLNCIGHRSYNESSVININNNIMRRDWTQFIAWFNLLYVSNVID